MSAHYMRNPSSNSTPKQVKYALHGYSVQFPIRIPDARWTAVSRLPGVFVSGDTP